MTLDCDGNCGVCPHNGYCPCVNPVVARSKTALRIIELRPDHAPGTASQGRGSRRIDGDFPAARPGRAHSRDLGAPFDLAAKQARVDELDAQPQSPISGPTNEEYVVE